MSVLRGSKKAPVGKSAPRVAEGDEESFHTEDSGSEADGEGLALAGDELEYHTEASEDEEVLDEGADEDDGDENNGPRSAIQAQPPLLPAHLLQPLPSPRSPQIGVSTALDQLTRKERIALRNKNRRAKKRTYDRIRRDSRGTGVIEAGEAAQIKRSVIPSSQTRVRNGRVGKQSQRLPLSDRQKLLETRHRAIQDEKRMPPSPRAKTRSKR